jgi:transmembrane sensor
MNERTSELIGRVLANEASSAEKSELESWLNQHPDNRRMFEALADVWQQPADSSRLPQTGQAFGQIMDRIADARKQPEPAQRSWLRSWPAAATVLLALCLGILAYVYLQSADRVPDSYARAVTPTGERTTITLADGSTVWLNTASRLHYPEKFDGHTREVHLDGEAFFNVQSNPEKPFIIHLPDGQIRVLGTSFNVKAYREDKQIETTVVSGKVAYIRYGKGLMAKNDTVIIVPDYQVIQSPKTREIKPLPVTSAHAKAWTEGKLIFTATPLDQAARTLERWYGIPVTLADPRLANCRLTGTFQDQSLEEVMTLIAMTKEFQYQLSSEALVITGKGCD